MSQSRHIPGLSQFHFKVRLLGGYKVGKKRGCPEKLPGLSNPASSYGLLVGLGQSLVTPLTVNNKGQARVIKQLDHICHRVLRSFKTCPPRYSQTFPLQALQMLSRVVYIKPKRNRVRGCWSPNMIPRPFLWRRCGSFNHSMMASLNGPKCPAGQL